MNTYSPRRHEDTAKAKDLMISAFQGRFWTFEGCFVLKFGFFSCLCVSVVKDFL